MKKYIAHIRKKPDGSFDEPQGVFEHLDGVAEFAGEFARDFGGEDWAVLMGRLHDIGKFSAGWQKSLRKETGYDLDAFVETEESKGNHSTLGAIAMQIDCKLGLKEKILAYVVAGHHAGLLDWEPGESGACAIERLYAGKESAGVDPKLNALLEDIRRDPEVDAFLKSLELPKTPPLAKLRNPEKKAEMAALHLWIRMLFSCVVDADFLDTERYMSPERFQARGGYTSLEELKKRLEIYMKAKGAKAPQGAVNDFRQKVLAACREKALGEPGVYTLSVPTGFGKTLASMVFALDHAVAKNKKRVIMGIPYMSITEQTAKVYKFGTDKEEEIAAGAVLFGDSNVIEHHSNIDPAKETLENRLACENWDAPIIVTTNVQLFESLAASRPSACRKLHNIANSVIVLDETQPLPSPYLCSILNTLKHLVEYFGVTVLFCSATQPVLTGKIGDGVASFAGFESVVEIFDKGRAELFNVQKRTEFFVQPLEQRYDEWRVLADELSSMERVLCVVNTRQSARDLRGLMPEGTYHLSALMCGEDRSDVIATVKEKLRSDSCVRLISTQLIEAGVDIDFPVVYRAFTGVDSIVQSAGRCNREGRMQSPGKVVVFNAPVQSPPGLLYKGEQTARALLKGVSSFELSDELFSKYFNLYYNEINDFDAPNSKNMMLKGDASFRYQFRTYAKNYHLIDQADQKAIIVPYRSALTGNSSFELIEQLERWCDYSVVRKLQRFIVNVPERTFKRMNENGMIRLVGDGKFPTLSMPDYYVPGIGLKLDEDVYKELFII